jgi:3D-(3,5/4)-trihydroxycyclohexane-1,2-dione acylhydrolase (decyclizing)
MSTTRLTAARALVRFPAGRCSEIDLFAGVWAIFGHGNVAATGMH